MVREDSLAMCINISSTDINLCFYAFYPPILAVIIGWNGFTADSCMLRLNLQIRIESAIKLYWEDEKYLDSLSVEIDEKAFLPRYHNRSRIENARFRP